MKDLMESVFKGTNPIIGCLDHGFVRLVDVMPRCIPDDEDSADYAIAEAARCSYQQGTKTVRRDVDLIRYLMRHDHTSPLEMIEFKFDVKLPIYVARQWIRHRTASVNELSGRYSELPDDFHIPGEDQIRIQSTTNLQGSDGRACPEVSGMFVSELFNVCEHSYEVYGRFLGEDVAREQARMVLPLNIYTQWYWKIDLHNLLHFLDLRTDSHAQAEIQVYANAILELIRKIVPHTIAAWEDYSQYRGGLKLTRMEVEAIRKLISTRTHGEIPDIAASNKLERKEWIDKAKKLGF